MSFGAYDTYDALGNLVIVATVNPTSDSSSPYSTTVTAVAAGSTAVWATAGADETDNNYEFQVKTIGQGVANMSATAHWRIAVDGG